MASQSVECKIQRLREKIAIGSEQANRREFVDGPKVFAGVRKRIAKRKRAKKRTSTQDLSEWHFERIVRLASFLYEHRSTQENHR